MALVAGKAVINVYPSMKGFKSSVNSELASVGRVGELTGSKIGSALSSAFKVGAAAAVALSASVVKIGKDAFEATARFQQLEGGVNKLFGDSSAAVLKNAQEAFKTAGLSANDYMDNVMKFSASLIQSLGGDTKKAAQIADTAIKDMGDNVNTFGSNIEDVQNAYQGFAKQNYTMLDNLRLGYGGTKKEMERLLADATKISGIKYDVSNFADVAQAIHVIQEEMEITGTTAFESAKTVEGSVASMKAAWQNFLTALGTGENVQQSVSNLVDSIKTTIKNAVPVISEILKGLPIAIGEALGVPEDKLSEFRNSLAEAGKQLKDLLDKPAVKAFIEALKELASESILTGLHTLSDIFDTISVHIETLDANFSEVKTNIEELTGLDLSNLSVSIGDIVSGVGALITLIVSIPMYITQAVTSVMSSITSAAVWVDERFLTIADVVRFVTNIIPVLFNEAVTKVTAIVAPIVDFFQSISSTIRSIFSKLGLDIGEGIGGAIKTKINSVLSFIESTVNNAVKLINKALSGIDNLPGVNIGRIGTLNLPRLAKGALLTSATPFIGGEDGAEAVMPLERHTGWIQTLARDISEYQQASVALPQQHTVTQYNTFTNVNPAEVVAIIDKYLTDSVEVYV